MSKKYPQPFWRESRACYFVQVGKKQVRLSPDKDEAYRLYHELMARPPEAAPEPVPAVAATPVLAAEVLDAFLDWCSRDKAPHTYRHYRDNIQRFVSRMPKDILAADLRPYHVTRALADFPDWSNNTKNDFIGALKRALNWAVEEGLLAASPLARLKKPAREAREMAVSPEEYARVLEAVKEPCFRDLVQFAWETGARVLEFRKIEAAHIESDRGRIVLPPSKAKGKKHFRIIYMTPKAAEIAARLAAANPEGVLFRNSDGNPWTKDAINCAFYRLEKKIGKKYHLGAFRKGYATAALKAGVDAVTLAHLMGHRDPSMVAKVYGQVQNDPEHMANAALRAKGQ